METFAPMQPATSHNWIYVKYLIQLRKKSHKVRCAAFDRDGERSAV